MAKLTRYSDFEKLKLHVEASDAVSDNKNEQQPEFEEFLNLLRSEILSQKKGENHTTTDGEPFNK